MNLDLIVRACQKWVEVEEDGKAGPETWKKIYYKLTGKTWVEPKVVVSEGGGDKVSERSLLKIATLAKEVQPYAKALWHATRQQGIEIEITSGLRTYAEQDALYNKHDGTTNAKGGHSNHNFGIAFDVTIFNGKTPIWSSPNYKAVGALGRSLGLEWGGDWKSFVDEPHFQLRPKWAKDIPESKMLAELRNRKATGTAIYA